MRETLTKLSDQYFEKTVGDVEDKIKSVRGKKIGDKTKIFEAFFSHDF